MTTEDETFRKLKREPDFDKVQDTLERIKQIEREEQRAIIFSMKDMPPQKKSLWERL